MKATGNLNSFAKRTGMSKRGLSLIIQEMKEMGFPIQFDRTADTYFYFETGTMAWNLFYKYGQVLTKTEVSNMSVGDPRALCFSVERIFRSCDVDTETEQKK